MSSSEPVIHRLIRRLCVIVAFVATLTVVSGGCSGIMDSLTGAYRGPQPTAQDIVSEAVVIRRIGQAGSLPALIVDRVQYVEAGDPHNINRAARVVATNATLGQLAALNLQPGDRVVLSTRFTTTTTESGSLSLPDWPGPGRQEYPIGVHAITSIARVGN